MLIACNMAVQTPQPALGTVSQILGPCTTQRPIRICPGSAGFLGTGHADVSCSAVPINAKTTSPQVSVKLITCNPATIGPSPKKKEPVLTLQNMGYTMIYPIKIMVLEGPRVHMASHLAPRLRNQNLPPCATPKPGKIP